MSNEFNKLEQAVINWFIEKYQDPLLSSQLNNVKLRKREWTKVGFFVWFEPLTGLLPLDLRNFNGGWPINGPDLDADLIEFGGGSIMWGEDGYITHIEMYAFGSYFGQDIQEFTVK